MNIDPLQKINISSQEVKAPKKTPEQTLEETALQAVQNPTDVKEKERALAAVTPDPSYQKTEERLSTVPSEVKNHLATSESSVLVSNQRPSAILNINWEKLRSLPPERQALIHFTNSMLINGIVCRKRSQELGLLQVSSLDKNPRPPNEVEINAYKTHEGIEKSFYDRAKGGIPILLERRDDKPPIDFAPLSPEEENQLSSLGNMAERFRKMKQETKPLVLKNTLEGQQFPAILTARAHAGMLILIKPSQLILRDNLNQSIVNVKGASHDIWVKEKLLEPENFCIEVKIDANIHPSCFSLIVLPQEMEKYKEFIVTGAGPIKFVDSIVENITYNFPPPPIMSNRTNTNCMVNISFPNFAKEADAFLDASPQEPYIIHHVAKGPVPSDPMFQEYWSKITEDTYDHWLTK